MRFLLNIIVILTSAAVLTACASEKSCCGRQASAPQLVEPDEAALRQSVTAFLQETGAPVSSMYETRRVDLDRDGKRDAVVLFKNPYGYWCDMHGCTMLVMKANSESFELVNAIQPVRALHLASTETNGWRDLIITVTGRSSASKDVAAQYNGGQYPANPEDLPPYLRVASAGAQRLFY